MNSWKRPNRFYLSLPPAALCFPQWDRTASTDRQVFVFSLGEVAKWAGVLRLVCEFIYHRNTITQSLEGSLPQNLLSCLILVRKATSVNRNASHTHSHLPPYYATSPWGDTRPCTPSSLCVFVEPPQCGLWGRHIPLRLADIACVN